MDLDSNTHLYDLMDPDLKMTWNETFFYDNQFIFTDNVVIQFTDNKNPEIFIIFSLPEMALLY